MWKILCTGRRAERFSDVVNAVEQLLFLTLEQRLVTFLLDESAEEGSDELSFYPGTDCRGHWKRQGGGDQRLKKAGEGGAHPTVPGRSAYSGPGKGCMESCEIRAEQKNRRREFSAGGE